MDETTLQIEVDSASTAQEAVQQISRAIGIVDPFGFAIFVKLFEKVKSDNPIHGQKIYCQ